MPENEIIAVSVAAQYDGLHELFGAVLDQDSYEKHKEESPVPAVCPVQPDIVEQHIEDPFSTPQDFGKIAANAFENDQRTEYRPETAISVAHSEQTETFIQISTEQSQDISFVLGMQKLMQTGSGSYLSSGSYLTSGSYRISSGSYRVSSGSFRMSSGSYRVSSGSYCVSSASALRFAAEMSADRPYLGSLLWHFDEGGYGLNLI